MDVDFWGSSHAPERASNPTEDVMAIAVRGHEQVRNYMRALGGEPRPSAIKKAKAEMSRFLAQRSKDRNQARKEVDSILAKTSALVLKQLHDASPDLKKENAQLRRVLEQRAKRKLERPRIRKMDSIISSDTAILTPPYDDQFTHESGTQQTANADKTKGTYDLAVQSFGDGNQEVQAGLISFFLCTVPGLQRFAAVIDFSDDWWDSAQGYVAHNDVTTALWVWGVSENTWVVQTPVQPSWQDGVSWFDHHGNDPTGDNGSISVETFFQGQASSWYHGWVWTDALAYSNGGGSLGFGASSIKVSISVPWMLFS
jgi:hypothetical protein